MMERRTLARGAPTLQVHAQPVSVAHDMSG